MMSKRINLSIEDANFLTHWAEIGIQRAMLVPEDAEYREAALERLDVLFTRVTDIEFDVNKLVD